jgi:hypothetical protein
MNYVLLGKRTAQSTPVSPLLEEAFLSWSLAICSTAAKVAINIPTCRDELAAYCTFRGVVVPRYTVPLCHDEASSENNHLDTV